MQLFVKILIFTFKVSYFGIWFPNLFHKKYLSLVMLLYLLFIMLAPSHFYKYSSSVLILIMICKYMHVDVHYSIQSEVPVQSVLYTCVLDVELGLKLHVLNYILPLHSPLLLISFPNIRPILRTLVADDLPSYLSHTDTNVDNMPIWIRYFPIN